MTEPEDRLTIDPADARIVGIVHAALTKGFEAALAATGMDPNDDYCRGYRACLDTIAAALPDEALLHGTRVRLDVEREASGG
jgi:hypothetical protein